ncbi:MAG: glycosyltransferase family 2 protein [Bacteroidales bacterium]|nr:glycosyltransferase family 2 protein [Bacteroidales bacterium]
MDISIIIPLFNEQESLEELTEWIYRVLQEQYSYEIIFIDDGSTDQSWNVIKSLSTKYPFIKAIRFNRNYGKSAALQVGFERARGEVVITMDADLQDNPEEIPALYEMIKDQKYDLVSGWKKKRYDPISKTIPTKFYNWTVRLFSGIPLHDFNCGLKAYRKEVVKNIELYGEMHRYIPVIVKWAGYQRIGEKVVVHRPRKYGYSKFGMARFIRGPLDLLTIMFVTRFGKRPMHFFGSMGMLLFFIGFVIAGYLAYAKIFMGLQKMAELPIFYLALLCMIIGSQLFIGGFIAEMVGRVSPDRNKYIIKEVIENNDKTQH